MLQLSGELHAPAVGAPNRKGAAIVISHPMTDCSQKLASTPSLLTQGTKARARDNPVGWKTLISESKTTGQR